MSFPDNQAFNELTENIYDELPIDFGFGLEYDNHVNVYSGSSQYRMIHIYQNDTIAGDWWAFDFYEEDSSMYTSLSSFFTFPLFWKNL